MSILSFRRACAWACPVLALIAAACTEPHQAEPARPPAPVTMAARLELSDSIPRAGDELRVTLRASGTMAPRVATVTARIAYDTTGLRFIDEVTATDGATRVLNPQMGMLRIAAIAPSGFADGQLFTVRFTVLRAAAASSLRLTLDEMHTATREDALAAMTRHP